jgi:hypothetical protein
MSFRKLRLPLLVNGLSAVLTRGAPPKAVSGHSQHMATVRTCGLFPSRRQTGSNFGVHLSQAGIRP